MTKVQIEMSKKVSENAFYGLRNCLLLFQAGGKGSVSIAMLTNAWNEVKDNKQYRELFFTILFSIGDVTARQHNLFGRNKVDSGGGAFREAFSIVMQWMKTHVPDQYKKFLFSRLFNEYTTFDNIFGIRVQTVKKTARVNKIVNMIGTSDNIPMLAEFAEQIIKGNNAFDKFLLAKFLTRPRFSKRQKHKKILPATLANMRLKAELIKQISDRCGFTYDVKDNYTDFKGWYEWRKPKLTEMESVVFSSGNAKLLDQQTFLAWIEQMPAGARFRVRKRILTKENQVKPKWAPLGEWYLQWEKFKENRQTEQRELEEKVRQGTATVDEKVELKAITKAAKVTTGAVNFQEIMGQILKGNVDKIKIQPFLDKINIPYNTLVFVDDSGSMHSSGREIGGAHVSAFEFATFIAAICLLKNPSDDGRNLIGMFSNNCRMFSSINAMKVTTNRFVREAPKEVTLPLYEPNLHFLDNLHNLRGFVAAHTKPESTNISAIPEGIHAWTQGDPAKIEQIQEFPIWTVITDGNWNNVYNPASSMNDFFMKCEKYFGFKPYVIAMDVSYSSANVDIFQGIPNMMYVPANPAAIEQFLVNYKDIETVDVYMPLLSLYRSNRYEPVRNAVL